MILKRQGMLLEVLIKIFKRDLQKLKTEINAYKNEDNMWLLPENINNCSGNLCLHIIGNLNHFIGATLGHTGYVRKRDLEFSLKNVPRKEMVSQVEEVLILIEKVLLNLKIEDMEKRYPIDVFGEPMSNEFFLTHLATHLSYHLGQINYHRRLLEN